MTTQACKQCKHYVKQPLVHYCTLKNKCTSVARITGERGSHKTIDCWEVE